MVQNAFDNLSKAYIEEFRPKLERPLEYLQAEFEVFVDLLDREWIPLTAIEKFCERFKEITPRDLGCFIFSGFHQDGEISERQNSAARKFAKPWEALPPYLRDWQERVLPGIEAKPPFWEGIERSYESWEPSGVPIDRAPVWHPIAERYYMKNIYRVTEKQKKGSKSRKHYDVVFEKHKIHSAQHRFVNPEGVPRVILKHTVRKYPVLVRKNPQGWEYVLLEPVD